MSQAPPAFVLGLGTRQNSPVALISFPRPALLLAAIPRGATLGQGPHFLSQHAVLLTRPVSLKVRNSLPASMLQHLDTGGVQVEVTRISSGSVVVEFNLLVIADVDVREVSATFLAAFQNASLLEVVGGDPFIVGK